MSKLKLGNDFNADGEDQSKSNIEAAEETSEEESEEESTDSTDTADGKNGESSEDKSTDDAAEEEEEEQSDESEDEGNKGKKDEAPDKSKELQGLLDTEKELDNDLVGIDSKIKEAKDRISAKRRARRDGRELVDTVDEKLPDTEDTPDDLADIDPETIKVLERFTKAKGLVPKSELARTNYQEKHKSAESAFYAAHPEYAAENDIDDVLYKALKEELADFAAPSDPNKIPKIFEKAHQAVSLRYPDRFKISSRSNDDKTNKSVRLKNQGLGGGNSGGQGGSSNSQESDGKKSLSEAQIDVLRNGGWSEQDIKDLTK